MNQQRLIVLIASIVLGIATGQAQDCDNIKVDLKKGTINKLKLKATQEKVKKSLPCFTGDSEDGSGLNCDGGVFYLNHDFFFYTGKDFLNLRKNFKGTLNIPLLGMTEAAATKEIGTVIRTVKSGESNYIFFKRSYGCLVLKIVKGTVNQIYLYAVPASEVNLCL